MSNVLSGAMKSRESRLRRRAKELGLYVIKSRAKTWTPDNQQGYQIMGLYDRIIRAGERLDLTLDAVEDYLREAALRAGGR